MSAATDPHHVECWRWNGIYFVLGEAFWSLYFIDHKSWAGLAAVGIFLGYERWRRWYAGRKANNVAKGCASERKTGDGPGNMASVKEIKVCMECGRSPLKTLDRGDLPGTHTEVILADGKTICYQCHLNAVIDSYVRPAK